MHNDLTFGQRHGFEPVRGVAQINGMDARLRNGLWSNIFELLSALPKHQYDEHTGDFYGILSTLWSNYFGEPVDTLHWHQDEAVKSIRTRFMKAEWFQVYSIVQIVAEHFESHPELQEVVIAVFNRTMERENAGYRFIGSTVSPITDENEAAEVQEALEESSTSVATHLQAALEKLSDRENPDYRNSVHESVGAVESAVRQMTGDQSAILSKALNWLKPKPHPALQQAFEKIYAYSSDEEGVRHSIKDGSSEVGEAEARFMLIACSAFVNYLRLRSGEVLK